MFALDQRFVNTENNPRNFRKGLTPTRNTSPTSSNFQLFKKDQNFVLQFFRQQLQGLCLVTIVFGSLPGMPDSMVSGADQSARSGF